MATTIRISDEIKKRLDKIKAQLLMQGVKLKQDELIEKLVILAEANPMLFQKQMFSGVDKETKKKIMSVSFDLGESSEETIDDDLYKRID